MVHKIVKKCQVHELDGGYCEMAKDTIRELIAAEWLNGFNKDFVEECEANKKIAHDNFGKNTNLDNKV